MMRIFLAVLVITSAIGCTSKKDDQPNSPPNIIYILADDLGYGELGVYGQEKIMTPNIDALAASGMIFMQHYSGSPVCAPSRCMLLTGLHPGHAEIRSNDEWRERGDVWDYAKAVEDPNLEGQRPLSSESFTLGEMLQSAGYRTALVGKWGLGAPNSSGIPTKNGFDFFYGYNCQRQAHQLYPRHLWKNEEKIWLQNPVVVPHQDNQLAPDADSMDLASYAQWQQQDYAPALMQKEALQFIRENRETPFFLYYASPLPHLPLQVPQPYVDRYVELFGDEMPYNGSKGYFPTRYPRATYAGMISYLDDQVGEIIAELKELGLYENTLVIFTSDNGPSYTGGVDAEFFNSAAPFSNRYGRTKGFTYEGGIRVPMIASWPSQVAVGSQTDHISAFWDVMPTLAELLELPLPRTDGISFLATLLGNTQDQKKHQHLYWEFSGYQGQQAVRMGDWKGIRKDILEGNLQLELYDLQSDPGEEKDLALEQPQIVAQIEAIMAEQHQEATIEKFRMPALGDRVIASEKP
ncbi:MAG: arylsulfatase [Cyclobacteriaceae bacterium]|nr:arylsulfatase [Cyclobacteriaceae bacterium]